MHPLHRTSAVLAYGAVLAYSAAALYGAVDQTNLKANVSEVADNSQQIVLEDVIIIVALTSVT